MAGKTNGTPIQFGENIAATVDGDELVLRIDLAKRLRPSSSGKTTLVATSGGSKPVPGCDAVKIGINAFVK